MNFEEKLIAIWSAKRPDIKSGRELERAIGLSNGQISKWRTSNPSQKTMQKIADFFHISVDSLLSGRIESTANQPVNNTDLASEGVFFYEGREISEDTMNFIRETLKRIQK